MNEFYDSLFFILRLYGAGITLGSALVIYLYTKLVVNPRFSFFAKGYWIVLLSWGLIRVFSIFYGDTLLTANNVISTALSACLPTWLFFRHLLYDYLPARKARSNYIALDLSKAADKALDILTFKDGQ